jgi:hypothetical protein
MGTLALFQYRCEVGAFRLAQRRPQISDRLYPTRHGPHREVLRPRAVFQFLPCQGGGDPAKVLARALYAVAKVLPRTF